MPVVTVAAPLVREITEWDDYVGRFEASRSVEVRPRVSGELTGIHFTDGQIVRKGQLLFTIDPRPFNAALAEARDDAASRSGERRGGKSTDSKVWLPWGACAYKNN